MGSTYRPTLASSLLLSLLGVKSHCSAAVADAAAAVQVMPVGVGLCAVTISVMLASCALVVVLSLVS